jgi:hypothetical protein
MTAPFEVTIEQALKAVKGSKGFITNVAKRLKCSRPTVYKLLEQYPELKSAISDERESQKDHVEIQLFKQIDQGNIAAIIFYLKTQAKDRGYIERQELTGADGADLLKGWLEELRNDG